MRLDLYLYTNKLAESRTRAHNLIKQGRVTVNGKISEKPSVEVGELDKVSVSKSEEFDFVGRGGNKLEHTFNVFSYTVEGKICVDIGASTGGFTQCLLLHGAKKVYAVDSGTNQLNEKLKLDERVVSMEGFNARNLTVSDLENNNAEIVVMDVSFISQKLLYPAILGVCTKDADVITLIKPQFEAGKRALGKHGVVKDEKTRQLVVKDIISCAEEMGFEYVAHCTSPITGGDGNVEYLLHLKVKS